MKKFIEMLKENIEAFESTDIAPDTNLTALEGWDSIALLSIMSIIASEYSVTLKGSSILEAATPKAIFDLINNSK